MHQNGLGVRNGREAEGRAERGKVGKEGREDAPSLLGGQMPPSMCRNLSISWHG